MHDELLHLKQNTAAKGKTSSEGGASEPAAKSNPIWQSLALSGAGPGLSVSRPGDPDEREADAVAERATREPSPAPEGACLCGGGCPKCSGGQRSVEDVRAEQPEAGRSVGADLPPVVRKGVTSPGEALPTATREFMESRFGGRFSGVRVHAGREAAESARAVEARAYTLGADVVFGENQYSPATPEGKNLLAHELAHVAQQSHAAGAGGARLSRQPQAPKAEGAEEKKEKPKLTWLQLLPRVHMVDYDKPPAKGKPPRGDQGLVTVQNEKDKAPALKYADASKLKVEAGAPEGQEREKITITDPEQLKGLSGKTETDKHVITGEALSVEMEGESLAEKALREVKEARAAIPARDIGRDPFQKIGNFYDPQRAAQQGDKQATDYNTWMASATPTAAFDSTKNDDLKKWQIFQKTTILEGRVGTFTTFDKTLTVGVGFSSGGGQGQTVINRFFTAVPALRAVAFAAGLVLDGSKMIVVDTEKGWILEGASAATYVQTDTALLSLLINASQGVQSYKPGETLPDAERDKQRQAVLNAQWQTFLERALGSIPGSVLAWPLDSVVLATHSRHAIEDTFPWSFWQAQSNTALRELVRALYRHLKATNQGFWLFPICGGIYKPHAEAVKAEEDAAAKP